MMSNPNNLTISDADEVAKEFIGSSTANKNKDLFMREYISNYNSGATTSATSAYYSVDPNVYAASQLRSYMDDMGRDFAFLEERVDKLSLEFGDTLGEALKQIGMADYKDRIQKEFKEIVKERLESTVSTVDKAYKALNERVNEFEKELNKRLEKLDQESAKRQLVLDKIDFLAKELGYQMDLAQKSF